MKERLLALALTADAQSRPVAVYFHDALVAGYTECSDIPSDTPYASLALSDN